MLLKELFTKEYKSDSIFFARSKACPKMWHYDHVGFIIDGGKQLQMSGHKHNDGVFIIYNENVTFKYILLCFEKFT